MPFDGDDLIRILTEVVRQAAQRRLRLRPEIGTIKIEQDVVGQTNGNLVLRGTGHFDAGNLLQLLLLLVHAMADRRADRCACRGADDSSGAVVAGLVTDHGADHGAGRGSRARSALGASIWIVAG